MDNDWGNFGNDSGGFDDNSGGFDGFGDTGDGGFGDSSDSGFDWGGSSDSNDDVNGFGDPDSEVDSDNGFVGSDYKPDVASSDYDSSNDYKPSNKGKAIAIIVAGLVIIIGVAVAGNFALKKNKKSNTANDYLAVIDNNVSNYEEETVSNHVEYSNESVAMPQRVDNGTVNTQPVQTNYVDKSGWQEVDHEEISFSDYIDGDFTVTSIKSFARSSKLGEMELKTEVTGSISGLSGTYEIDVPYTIGGGLKIGNTFSIKYKIGNIGDNTFISDITY